MSYNQLYDDPNNLEIQISKNIKCNKLRSNEIDIKNAAVENLDANTISCETLQATSNITSFSSMNTVSLTVTGASVMNTINASGNIDTISSVISENIFTNNAIVGTAAEIEELISNQTIRSPLGISFSNSPNTNNTLSIYNEYKQLSPVTLPGFTAPNNTASCYLTTIGKLNSLYIFPAISLLRFANVASGSINIPLIDFGTTIRDTVISRCNGKNFNSRFLIIESPTSLLIEGVAAIDVLGQQINLQRIGNNSAVPLTFDVNMETYGIHIDFYTT